MQWYWWLLIAVALIYLLILFMTSTGNKHKVWNHDWLFERPIAHRGYHLNNCEVPENSKIAFQRAIDNHYNIETDINLTKDNKVVVFHDTNLKRMCGVDKNVYELTLDELKALTLKDGEEHILELQEFLDLVNGQTGILMEYKGINKEIDTKLCEESMKIFKDYQGDWEYFTRIIK